jgi:hypothetical protein
MSKRVEFTNSTKCRIAARSGYRCAYLNCDRATAGPGATPNDVSITGEAAHIWSATEGGPRGQGGLTEADLRHTQNGIWLCRTHAKIVDEKRGVHFPAALLMSYRDLHEARIAREQQGIARRMAWIDRVTVAYSAVFEPLAQMTLAKVTLVIGNNASGRTALCEWISAFERPDLLKRWQTGSRFTPLRIELKLFDPDEHSIGLGIDAARQFHFDVNDVGVAYNPFPFRPIWLRDDWSIPMPDNDDDWIASLLGIDSYVVRNVLREVREDANAFTRNPRIEVDDEGHRRIRAHNTDALDLPLRVFSTGERGRLLVDVAIALARTSARFVPTILLLDGFITSFDSQNLRTVAARLASAENQFQSILFMVSPRDNDAMRRMSPAWQTVHLRGRQTNVKIEVEGLTSGIARSSL